MILVFAYLFQACEDDITENYGQYPISWMPVTNLQGEKLKPSYTEGDQLQLVLKFKNFEGNEVQKISLNVAEVDEATGNPGSKTMLTEYASSNFVEVPEEKQFKVNVNFDITAGLYTDKKIQLSALIETIGGSVQDRELAVFTVSEYFPYVIENIDYYYMYNNTHTDAGLGYTTEHSAGYTALTTIMNYYGFDPANATFQAELGGDITKHTPDWVASYYVSVWPGYLAQTVYELHQAYHYEAPYYGGSKLLSSTEFGTYAEIDEAIENGQPVIVHGNFKGGVSYKHQMILVATNDNSFMALDPSGKWDGNVNGSYIKNETAGLYVKYSKSDVYAAIGESGSVWMHIPVDPENESVNVAD